MPWTMDAQPDHQRVIFRFEGRLSKSEGAASAEAFKEFLAKHAAVHVVWNIEKMTGYESDARRAWQSILWPCRANSSHISVVGGGALVRVGATSRRWRSA